MAVVSVYTVVLLSVTCSLSVMHIYQQAPQKKSIS